MVSSFSGERVSSKTADRAESHRARTGPKTGLHFRLQNRRLEGGGAMPATTTVRITQDTSQTLRDLAATTGQSMQDVLAQAVEAYSRQLLLDEVNHAYAALRADPSAGERSSRSARPGRQPCWTTSSRGSRWRRCPRAARSGRSTCAARAATSTAA